MAPLAHANTDDVGNEACWRVGSFYPLPMQAPKKPALQWPSLVAGWGPAHARCRQWRRLAVQLVAAVTADNAALSNGNEGRGYDGRNAGRRG
jgi:hypothetical protein